MFSGVPTFVGQVDAATERHHIIDDDDLLVMDRSGRMCAIDGELQSARR